MSAPTPSSASALSFGGDLEDRVRDLEEQVVLLSESLTRSFSQLKDAVLAQGQEFRRLLLEQETRFNSLLDESISSRDDTIRELRARASEQDKRLRNMTAFQGGVYDTLGYNPDVFDKAAISNGTSTTASPAISRSMNSGDTASSPNSKRSTSSRRRGLDDSAVAALVYSSSDAELSSSPGNPAEEVNAIWQKYKAPLESIYLYYAYLFDFSKSRATIGRSEFNKFVRDVRAFDKLSDSGVNHPDLIFMRVHQLSKTADHILNNIPESEKVVHPERLEFNRGEFQTGLVLLAESLYGHRVDLPQAQRLELFLLSDVFPNAKSQSFISEECPELDDPLVRDLLKNQKKILREVFDTFSSRFASKREYAGSRLCFKGLSELLKYYELHTTVTKQDLREIYRLSARSSFDSGMTFGEFLEALCMLAYKAYGSDTFLDTYPTPISRVEKVMTKLTLLANPLVVDTRGN